MAVTRTHGRRRTESRLSPLLEASHLTSVALAAPISTARVCSSAEDRKRNIHRRLYADLADGIVFSPNAGGERSDIAAARGLRQLVRASLKQKQPCARPDRPTYLWGSRGYPERGLGRSWRANDVFFVQMTIGIVQAW
jgi:hypothetical protein